jgi:hypothetical protein
MSFFSRLFGKDTIKLEDVRSDAQDETPFISPEEEREKVCPPQAKKGSHAASSPFLDECDPGDQK